MENKYKIKIINETILDAISETEAKMFAEILSERMSFPSYVGNIGIMYTEIEKVGN